jgi:SAM-dependent methyltransferase
VNVPTVAYWDPELWPTRTGALPFFDELRQVGILWDTPEEASAKVAAIYEHPALWWDSPRVQSARQRFTERFALASGQWLEEWKRLLLDELARAQKSQPTSCGFNGAEGPQTRIMDNQMISERDGHVPATEVDGYRIEMWKAASEIRQIEYASYWNNETEEIKKDVFWIFDGNFRKMEEYLEKTFLTPQLNQMLGYIRVTLGRTLSGTGADLAAGNLWAVPHMLKAGEVRRIYAVEYSVHRLAKIGPVVLKGYGIPKEKVVLCVGSFYELKIPSASLDFVFMSQAFHHADDPLRLLAEIRRVLRPGGLVLMIGEHITETPKVPLRQLQDLRVRLSDAEARRSWKPLLAPEPILGDHCYFEEEYDAMFSCTGFTYHSLKMPGSKFQSFVLVRDYIPLENDDITAKPHGDREQLQSALSRLNTRLKRQADHLPRSSL